MKRILMVGLAMAGWLACSAAAQAQVVVSAPFVRVYTGDGVAVRAPFVNLYVPPAGPVIYGPRVIYLPPPVVVQQPAAQPATVVPLLPPENSSPAPVVPSFPPPPAPIAKSTTPPPPIQAVQVPTLESFSRTFQAKAGSYDVTLVNPITQTPTAVHFTLPDGTPRRVIVTRDSIEWHYGLRQWVRIEFDRKGATVVSR